MQRALMGGHHVVVKVGLPAKKGRRPWSRVAAAIAGLGMFVGVGQAHAQADWPSKTVRIIVGAPAGGVSDILARLLAEQMSNNLKQPFIVENKPGGAGVLAVNPLLAAPADGTTMLIGTSATIVEVPQVVKLPYNTLKDLTQVAQLVEVPLVLVGNPAVPAQTLEELIAYAKANPGKLSVASYSAGSRSHFAGVVLNHKAGIDLLHVPYKGSPPAVADLLGGQVPLAFEALPNVLKYIQSGKLKPFAVLTPERTALLPHVPTMAERGFPDVGLTGWQGVWVSSKTPEALTNRMHTEVVKAFAAPKIKQTLDGNGYDFAPVRSVQQQNTELKQLFDRNAAYVKEFNIKVD